MRSSKRTYGPGRISAHCCLKLALEWWPPPKKPFRGTRRRFSRKPDRSVSDVCVAHGLETTIALGSNPHVSASTRNAPQST